MRKFLLALLLHILLAISLLGTPVYKNINVVASGTLTNLLSTTEKNTVTNLTITGLLDARDFLCLRDEMPNLSVLDIADVEIQLFDGFGGTYPPSWGSTTYPANELPKFAFYNSDLQQAKVSLTKIILPESITSIGTFAFSNCSGLSSIDIPASVTVINSNAFYQCTGLSSVIIPNQVRTLGNSVFQFCSGLTEITLGAKVSNLGLQCFYECSELKTIHSLNTTPPLMPGNSFDFTYINMVYVPNTSAVIAYRASSVWKKFSIGVNELITVDNVVPGSLASKINALGLNIAFITQLRISGVLNSTDIFYLRNQATVLTDLDLSQTTLENNMLPHSAFQGRSTLTNVKLPNSIETIGDNAFSSCSNLKCNVPLPENLISIGKSAFYGCAEMTGGLNFPSNLVSIGESAFLGCTGLEGTIIFPHSLTVIGKTAFSSCSGLTGTLQIPNSVTTIGAYAFQNCSSLSGELILSNQITKIDYGTFANCSGLTGALNIPASVVQIQASAFGECSQIEELNLSKFVESIGGEAFYRCSSINKISSPRSTPPTIAGNTFVYVDKVNTLLEVSDGATAAYQADNYWKHFQNINEVRETVNLKVIGGENGSIMDSNTSVNSGAVLEVDKNTTKTFTFIPEPNYVVYTLTYNGENVLNELSNNEFTTPLITDSATLEVTFEKAFLISVDIALEEGGSVLLNFDSIHTGTQVRALKDDVKTFTIIPKDGYLLEKVKYAGNDITLPLVNNQFTTDSIRKNDTLSVIFKKILYDVLIQKNTGGTVLESGVEISNGTILTVEPNQQKQFSFIPDEGYVLDSVLYNATLANIVNNEFQTPPINQHVSLNVVFKESSEKFNITIEVGANGQVKENNVLIVDGAVIEVGVNAVKTYTILPDEDYELDKVMFGGVDVTAQVTTDGQFVTNNITADKTLVVTFKERSYELTVLKNNGGIVKIDNQVFDNLDTSIVSPLSTVTVIIKPNAGYVIDKLEFNGINVKNQLNDSIFVTPAISTDSKLNVSFKEELVSITIKNPIGGVVNYNNAVLANNQSIKIRSGETATFSFLPKPGYSLSYLTFGGDDVLSSLKNDTYTTPPVKADAILNVGFIKTLNYLYVKIIGGGTIEGGGYLPIGGNDIVEAGSQTTFKFIPNPGYKLESVYYDNVDVTSQVVNNKYTTPPAQLEQSTLKIIFKALDYEITILKNDEGQVMDGDIVLENQSKVLSEYGSTRTFLVKPNVGYEVDTLLYGGEDMLDRLSDNLFTTDSIKSNDTLKVVFKKKKFDVVISTNSGGIVKIGNEVFANNDVIVVEYGETIDFEVITDDNYRIDSLMFGDIDILENNAPSGTIKYTTEAITESSVLYVVFVNTTSVWSIGESEVKVFADQSGIILENVPVDTFIQLYSVDGQRIWSAKSNNNQRIIVPVDHQAIYFIKIGGKTYKVMVR